MSNCFDRPEFIPFEEITVGENPNPPKIWREQENRERKSWFDVFLAMMFLLACFIGCLISGHEKVVAGAFCFVSLGLLVYAFYLAHCFDSQVTVLRRTLRFLLVLLLFAVMAYAIYDFGGKAKAWCQEQFRHNFDCGCVQVEFDGV